MHRSHGTPELAKRRNPQVTQKADARFLQDDKAAALNTIRQRTDSRTQIILADRLADRGSTLSNALTTKEPSARFAPRCAKLFQYPPVQPGDDRIWNEMRRRFVICIGGMSYRTPRDQGE